MNGTVSRVTVVSKSFEGQTDKTEEWYDTQYKQEAISEETIKVKEILFSLFDYSAAFICRICSLLYNEHTFLFQKWSTPGLNPNFSLPRRNEFIPTNFQIYPLEEDSSSGPTLIKVSV